MRRMLIALTTVLALLVGYGAADAYDQVPGVLTIDERPTEDEPQAPDAPAVLEATDEDAPVPTRAGLAKVMGDKEITGPLGPRVAYVVRDALTGKVLLARNEDRGQIPASTAKLLTAAAIAEEGDLSRTMKTKVVTGTRPGELVLVAGGDTMLAPGKGDPTAVEGRAGLASLAQQVADSLEGQVAKGKKPTLRLDNTYAHGPRYAPGWDMADVAAGYTQGVSMVGLAGDRPQPGEPSPRVPERVVLKALAAQLKKAGVEVKVDSSAKAWQTAAPTGAETLGTVESAPIGDVLAVALDDSDNALTENVARQVAFRHGAGTSFKDVTGWVRTTLRDAGVDMSGVRMRDSSGLSSGQEIPVRVVSDVVQLGITGSAPSLTRVLADLPVAGLDGTMFDRFQAPRTRTAAGIARAKTGTLTGTSALAGTTTTRDGRLLTYVINADRVPEATGTLGARDALDRMVAGITACGCR